MKCKRCKHKLEIAALIVSKETWNAIKYTALHISITIVIAILGIAISQYSDVLAKVIMAIAVAHIFWSYYQSKIVRTCNNCGAIFVANTYKGQL